MRLTLIIPIFIIVTLAGIYGAGTALPVERTTIIGTNINVPRDILWATLSKVETTAVWDKDIVAVSPLPDPSSDNGMLWHFEYKNGQYSILRTENHSVQHTQYREFVEASSLPLGRWKITLSETPQGSFVKLHATQRTDSPWLRFLRYYFFQPDAEARKFLEMLASHYDSKPEIQELAV